MSNSIRTHLSYGSHAAYQYDTSARKLNEETTYAHMSHEANTSLKSHVACVQARVIALPCITPQTKSPAHTTIQSPARTTHNTQRLRAANVMVCVAAALLLICATLVFNHARAEEHNATTTFISSASKIAYEVKPTDSLYSIVQTHCKTASTAQRIRTEEVAQWIQQYNKLKRCTLTPGQILIIPTQQ